MPRPGFLTPSTFPDLMKPGKNGEAFGKVSMSIVERLAMDLLKVQRPEDVSAPSLEWGKQNEETAIFIYEQETLRQVKKARFRVCPDLAYVGGTMDGLVKPDGGIEIKCPANSSIHLFRREEHYEAYKYQLHGYLWVYGLNWLDFVSYDPRCPQELQLMVRRVERDNAIIETIEARCREAHGKALKIVEQVRENYVEQSNVDWAFGPRS